MKRSIYVDWFTWKTVTRIDASLIATKLVGLSSEEYEYILNSTCEWYGLSET